MQIDIKTAIGWCAGVGLACISGTYVVTDNLLKTEVEQYKQSSQWKLPQLLEDLGSVSEKLSVKLSDSNELDRLRKFETEQKENFEQLKKELTEIKERLAHIEGESVFIDFSETVPLGEPGLLLGMIGTILGYDDLKLRVAKESFTLGIGENHTYLSKSTRYTFAYKGYNPGKGYEVVIVRELINKGGK